MLLGGIRRMRGLSLYRSLSALSGTALGICFEGASRALSTGSDLKSALKDKIPEQQVCIGLASQMTLHAKHPQALPRDTPGPSLTLSKEAFISCPFYAFNIVKLGHILPFLPLNCAFIIGLMM